MVENLNNIIKSILEYSTVWIFGPYGSGKTSILNHVKEYFSAHDYDVRFCYSEDNETPFNLFYKITKRESQNFNHDLNKLLMQIKKKHKKGLVIIIDELNNAFKEKGHKNVVQIVQFIQFLVEFILNYNSYQNKFVFLIISSQELNNFLQENYLSRVLNKFFIIYTS